MRVMVIYGNPKAGGFVHGCLDRMAARLEGAGAAVERLRLNDAEIRECVGCFRCLSSGVCSTHDAMADIIARMVAADGLVVGASVRNGLCPALYKKFYERIIYLVGFTRALRGKPVVAIGSVGMAGGKRVLGRVLSMREAGAHCVDFLFFRTGIPTRLTPDDEAERLDRAADRLAGAIARGEPLSMGERLALTVDDWVMRTFMLRRDRRGTYAHIVDVWKKKGWM